MTVRTVRTVRQRWRGSFVVFGRAAEFEAFEPREYFARGDDVVVPGYERRRIEATGREVEAEWAMVFALSGEIAPFHNLVDSHAAAAAHRGARGSGLRPDRGERTRPRPAARVPRRRPRPPSWGAVQGPTRGRAARVMARAVAHLAEFAE